MTQLKHIFCCATLALLFSNTLAAEDGHATITSTSAFSPSESADTFTKAEAWKYGILSSFGVSIIGFVMSALLVPLLRSKKVTQTTIKIVIRILIAFSVGALLSDALVHIIPEIYGAHAHEEEEEAEGGAGSEPKAALSSLFIIVGVGAFILLEWFFEWVGYEHSHGDEMHSHSHGHSDNHNHEHKHDHAKQHHHNKSDAPNPENAQEKQVDSVRPDSLENVSKDHDSVAVSIPTVVEAQQQEQKPPTKASWFHRLFSLKGRKTVGIMILLADFIHNTMDGLAIGVAFSSGKKNLAISTVAAIVAHEIPKEIGGMGILVDSQFTTLQALFCNGTINFSALIGTVIGLAVGSVNDAVNTYVLAFVAGNFLYISLVSMLPLLVKETRKKVNAAIMAAFSVGVAIQFALLKLESE